MLSCLIGSSEEVEKVVKFLDAIPKVISTLVSILVTLIVLNVGIFVYICTFTQLINAML